MYVYLLMLTFNNQKIKETTYSSCIYESIGHESMPSIAVFHVVHDMVDDVYDVLVRLLASNYIL